MWYTFVMKPIYILLILLFIVLYSALVFYVKTDINLDITAQLTAASAFFFALFSGFFIARQNDRYTRIVDIIADRDGLFSYLYRVFGMVPRVQNEMREVIKNHYSQILKNNDWAYNEFHPSNTISNITKLMSSLTEDELKKIDGYSPFDGIWDTILQLQQIRKRIIAAYKERLLLFQWILIYVFGLLTIFSFYFVNTDSVLINTLKVVFGTAVFLVIILIKQLNDLSIFGKDFSINVANDVLRIVDEHDAKMTGSVGTK